MKSKNLLNILSKLFSVPLFIIFCSKGDKSIPYRIKDFVDAAHYQHCCSCIQNHYRQNLPRFICEAINVLDRTFKAILPQYGWTLKKITGKHTTTHPINKSGFNVQLAENCKYPNTIDHDNRAVVCIGIFPDFACYQWHIHKADH